MCHPGSDHDSRQPNFACRERSNSRLGSRNVAGSFVRRISPSSFAARAPRLGGASAHRTHHTFRAYPGGAVVVAPSSNKAYALKPLSPDLRLDSGCDRGMVGGGHALPHD